MNEATTVQFEALDKWWGAVSKFLWPPGEEEHIQALFEVNVNSA
jgi:hypothetical protein